MGINLNRKKTPLIDAAGDGDVDTVRKLLAASADAGERFNLGLRRAALRGHAEIVEILLQHGADANATDGEPMQFAAAGGHVDVIEILLRHGAKVEQDDANQMLEAAARKGDLATVKKCVELGADVQHNDNFALRQACLNGQDDLVSYLIDKGADVNAGDGEPLVGAARYGYDDTVGLLIDKGANVDANGATALFAALDEGHPDAAKLLVFAGAKCCTGGVDCLQIAVEGGRKDLVSFMTERGVDVTPDKMGPALRTAAGRGHFEIAQLLVERGADVNETDNEALLQAVKADRPRIAHYLMDKGADPFARGGEIEKAALEHPEMAKLLLEWTQDHCRAQFKSIVDAQGNLDTLREAIDDRGTTGLILAAQAGCFQDVLDRINESGEKLTADDLTRTNASGNSVIDLLHRRGPGELNFLKHSETKFCNAHELRKLRDMVSPEIAETLDFAKLIDTANVRAARQRARGIKNRLGK